MMFFNAQALFLLQRKQWFLERIWKCPGCKFDFYLNYQTFKLRNNGAPCVKKTLQISFPHVWNLIESRTHFVALSDPTKVFWNRVLQQNPFFFVNKTRRSLKEVFDLHHVNRIRFYICNKNTTLVNKIESEMSRFWNSLPCCLTVTYLCAIYKIDFTNIHVWQSN